MNNTEKNILIAEFMGVKESDELYKGHPTFVGTDLIKAGLPFSNIMGNCINNLPFDTSWDWLMPVIEKITNKCEEPEELDELKYALLSNDIETAYSFVVDYITN